MKYVVDYEIWTGTGSLRNKGQRDVESAANLDGSAHNARFVATLIAAQIILADPADRIVVTGIRPA